LDSVQVTMLIFVLRKYLFFPYLEICKKSDPIHKKYAGNNARTNAHTDFEIFSFS
jgi:hypothetical protein